MVRTKSIATNVSTLVTKRHRWSLCCGVFRFFGGFCFGMCVSPIYGVCHFLLVRFRINTQTYLSKISGSFQRLSCYYIPQLYPPWIFTSCPGTTTSLLNRLTAHQNTLLNEPPCFLLVYVFEIHTWNGRTYCLKLLQHGVFAGNGMNVF
jgi:hypothetical protein